MKTPRNCRVAPLLFTLAACTETQVQCLYPPCAIPQAIEFSLSGSASHGAVPGAFVVVTNQAGSGPLPCNQGATTTCFVPGSYGTYEVDISAPGYQTVHRRVVVTGSTPKCGCVQVNLEHVSVTLDPTT